MRDRIKCYACMEQGVVIMGDLFTVRRCNYCFGKGWRYIYSGDMAKEEKRLDDLREESLNDERSFWEQEKKEMRKYEF